MQSTPTRVCPQQQKIRNAKQTCWQTSCWNVLSSCTQLAFLQNATYKMYENWYKNWKTLHLSSKLCALSYPCFRPVWWEAQLSYVQHNHQKHIHTDMSKPRLSSGGYHKLQGKSPDHSSPSYSPCSKNCKHIFLYSNTEIYAINYSMCRLHHNITQIMMLQFSNFELQALHLVTECH